jgi:hypothetical protein
VCTSEISCDQYGQCDRLCTHVSAHVQMLPQHAMHGRTLLSWAPMLLVLIVISHTPCCMSFYSTWVTWSHAQAHVNQTLCMNVDCL